MQAFRKLAAFALAAALLVAPLVGDAIAASEKTNKRFCNRYADSMASIVSQAMKQNSACLDTDRGVHPSAEHHFGWCMQNTRSTVSGAAKTIRVLVKKCTGSASGALKQGNKKAKNGGERFCQQYADTTAAVVSDALKVNASCMDPGRGVHPDAKSHYTWCMKTPRSEVEGAGMHIRDLVAACTQ